jgi:hypothetical protein
MRNVSRALPGLSLELSEISVRARLLGALETEAREALTAALRERPGALVEIDLEGSGDLREDDAVFLCLEASRAERAGARVKLLSPSAASYERLRRAALSPLAIEVRSSSRAHPEGQDWGRFRVERILASPRGQVAFALDPDAGRRVVIKVPEAHERAAFVDAARAWAAKGAEKNLVRVLEVDAGRGFAVLEAVAGPSLDEVIQRGGPLELSQALAIARGVARGLARLASAPGPSLVHGDVKPANVLVGKDGVPLLSDLELLRTAGAPAPPAATRGYAAPERIAGAAAAEAAQDVFSFGALLHELLFGLPPSLVAPGFDRATAREDAPPALLGLVLSCLHQDPLARPPWGEVEALLAALGKAASEDAFPCAACGRFVYREAAAPYECLLCGGPTRPRAVRGAAEPSGESLAARLDLALRSGDAATFEKDRKAGLAAAAGEPLAALAAAQALLRLGRPVEAAELALACGPLPGRLRGEAALVLAEARLDQDDPRGAREALEAASEELVSSAKRSILAALLRARARDEEGDLEGALAEAGRARRAALEADRGGSGTLAATVEARSHLRRGAVEPARATLEHAVLRARESDPGTSLALAEARRLLAIVHGRLGSFRRAEELAREAHDAFAEGGSPLGIARASRTLAGLFLEEGRTARAAETLGVARILATRLGAGNELLRIRLLEVDLALERGERGPALAAADAAVEVLARAPSRSARDRARVAEARARAGAAALAGELARGLAPGPSAALDAARAEAESAVSGLARAKAWDLSRALATLALAHELEAMAGRASGAGLAGESAAAAERAALEARLPLEAARAAGVQGRLALGRAEPASAVRHLERAMDHAGTRLRAGIVSLRLDLARAYLDSGRKSEAAEAREHARAIARLLGREDLAS